MKKIDIASIDRKTGITTHDLLREGSAHDLDPIKVSAVVKAFADALNFCLEDLERMHKEVHDALHANRKVVRKINKLKKETTASDEEVKIDID